MMPVPVCANAAAAVASVKLKRKLAFILISHSGCAFSRTRNVFHAKSIRREGESNSNPVFREPRMRIENLFDGFSCRQLFENGLHGYASADYDGLAHHHMW